MLQDARGRGTHNNIGRDTVFRDSDIYIGGRDIKEINRQGLSFPEPEESSAKFVFQEGSVYQSIS